MDNTIYLFDSAKGQKVAFESLQKGKASLYVCGPTVYDDAHLGHARSAIAFDLLWRLLEYDGYAVRFVKNFTDIDDKILKKSAQTGQPAHELTQHYIESYLHDMDALGVRRAHFEPRATQSLPQICAMIATLVASGHAYQTSSGVYFSVAKDSKYGDLSHHYEDEDDTQSRIHNDEEKHDVRDFVLWKNHKEGESIAYDSPFGSGRPGWHIECSAMIEQYFETNDDTFAIDIHAGGSDLFFPHHENEATQTRCATHKEIAKYWLHNGFVTINEQKMSKSLGNSFFIKDALKLYGGEVLRFYLLSTPGSYPHL
ncbi:MAG: cysteine--tRNA ligase, partial [Helicobacter sp.]|nr:cysteine--tRNA ligase [Helicobacter sp.]